jgi:hypothetical protein
MNRLHMLVFVAVAAALSACGKSPVEASQGAHTIPRPGPRADGIGFGSGNRAEVGRDSSATAELNGGEANAAEERGGLTLGSGN